MFRSIQKCSVIAAALAACVAFASTAEAGGYAGNGCVASKQKSVGKYAKSVGKAWIKYPADATARNEAIAKALTKLDGSWTKAEAKAVAKNASCNESTGTSAGTAAIVDAAIAAISTENFEAVTGYSSAAMKAWSKYIKDPVKDPGKATLEAALNAASGKYLAGATPIVITAADELESDLVEATTNAPDYPTDYTQITPGSSVLYGKETLSPVCIDGDPYIFWARKGSNNKVLMYYQGGGACWNAASCFGVPGGTCSRTADAADNPALSTTGFGDWNDPTNPFHEWNVVFVTYCSCDVHWGEKITNYGPGQLARHYGRVNAKVAEKFAREHFVDPEEVFVTGSSAGSYGAIMNSYWLMKEVWPNAEYSVLGDAGVGVITQGFLDDYIDNWGVEVNFPADLPGVELPVQSLSLVDLIDGLATNYPENRFANYDSSYDGGGGSQCNFFQVMRNLGNLGEWGNWWESACEWNACMKEFKAENFSRAPTNYRYFTGAGTRHTMFGSDKVYTETKSTRSDTNAGMTIRDWVQAMIDDTPDWVNVDCNNPGGDCNLTNSCQGGPSAGAICTTNADCGGVCEAGSNDGNACTVNADCPDGGFCAFCQQDPDTANAPFNNDDTVNCAPTTCPCGPANAKCVGGTNDGATCTTDAECPGTGGACVWVNCSAN
jgi:hypothetical protein